MLGYLNQRGRASRRRDVDGYTNPVAPHAWRGGRNAAFAATLLLLALTSSNQLIQGAFPKPSSVDLLRLPFEDSIPSGTSVASKPAQRSTGTEGCTDINSASSASLQSIVGIGPAKARAILEDIKRNGPLREIGEVTRVSGVGPSTLANIRRAGFCVGSEPGSAPEVTTSASGQPEAASTGQPASQGCSDINTANSSMLQSVSGIGPAKAQAILEYIKSNGPFRDIADVSRVSGVGPATLRNIREAGFCAK